MVSYRSRAEIVTNFLRMDKQNVQENVRPYIKQIGARV